jgi:GNAT superfamily N-acetyltransferase
MEATQSVIDEANERMVAIILSAELPRGLRIAPMDLEAWNALAEPLLDEVLAERRYVAMTELYAPEVVERATVLEDAGGSSGVVHRFGIWEGDELVGAYRGRQTDAAVYHMTVSAIRPAWQRKGVYKALLNAVLEAAEDVGFLQVQSSHHADNNPILIAKLARGFVINGLTSKLRTGLMVTMVYRFSERARAQHRANVSS